MPFTLKIKSHNNNISGMFYIRNRYKGQELGDQALRDKMAEWVKPRIGGIHQLKHFSDLLEREHSLEDWNKIRMTDNLGWNNKFITEKMVNNLIIKIENEQNIDVRGTECECNE